MGCRPPFNTPSGQNQCNNSMDSPLKLEGIVHQIKSLLISNLTHLPAFHVHIMDSFFVVEGVCFPRSLLTTLVLGSYTFPSLPILPTPSVSSPPNSPTFPLGWIRDMHAQIINSIKDLQLDGEDPRKLLQSWGRLRFPRHALQWVWPLTPLWPWMDGSTLPTLHVLALKPMLLALC